MTDTELFRFYPDGLPMLLDMIEERDVPLADLLRAFAGEPPTWLRPSLAEEEWLHELLWQWLKRAEPHRKATPPLDADDRWRWEWVRWVCPLEESRQLARMNRFDEQAWDVAHQRACRAWKRAVLRFFPEVMLTRKWVGTQFRRRDHYYEVKDPAYGDMLLDQIWTGASLYLNGQRVVTATQERPARVTPLADDRTQIEQDIPAPEWIPPEPSAFRFEAPPINLEASRIMMDFQERANTQSERALRDAIVARGYVTDGEDFRRRPIMLGHGANDLLQCEITCDCGHPRFLEALRSERRTPSPYAELAQVALTRQFFALHVRNEHFTLRWSHFLGQCPQCRTVFVSERFYEPSLTTPLRRG